MITIIVNPKDTSGKKSLVIDDNGLRMFMKSWPRQYAVGIRKPHFPVPAIPYADFDNPIASIAIWPGVLQIRISDEYLTGEYTGFGAVITFEHGVSCKTRYDDFN